jgi:transcriptional regulator with XRE-family HTH domain
MDSVSPRLGTFLKVPGLHREQVAHPAAMSVNYYTQLEQDRVRTSASVLATLARALRLDEDQKQYMHELAGKSHARPRRRLPAQRTRPTVQRLLDQLTRIAAMGLGERLDILAWHRAAAALSPTSPQFHRTAATT